MKKTAFLTFVVLLAGCTVGPNYKRPAVNVPGGYREPAVAPSTSVASESLGNEKWWEIFRDPDLQELIRTALKENYDVQIAATRVLQAQAQLGITRANQFPALEAGGRIFSERNPQIASAVHLLMRRMPDKSISTLSGTSTSGASTVDRPRLRAPKCLRLNGVAAPLSLR